MTEPELLTIAYEGQDRQVSWQGVSMKDGDAFNSFMSNEVAARLYDEEGKAEFETPTTCDLSAINIFALRHR